MLGLGQIGFAEPQFPLGFLRGRHIRYRPDKFDATKFIFHCVSRHMDMLLGSIRHQQSVLMFVIPAIDGCPVDHLLYRTAIFRVSALNA